MPVRSDMVDSVMNSPRGARLLSAERRANTAHFMKMEDLAGTIMYGLTIVGYLQLQQPMQLCDSR